MTDDALTPNITLSQAMSDPSLFGPTFKASSFWTWKVVAKTIDGAPLTEKEFELFKLATGRSTLPARKERRLLRRLILLAGRRAGKDRFFSAVAVWRAALCFDWRKYISPGEQSVVLLLGKDKKQAAILRRYCEGLLQAPLLAREVARSTRDVIEFRNGGTLEIITNDAGLVRGRSAIGVFGSECCHWTTDEHSSSNDEEVVSAAEPSMAMCPDGGILLLGSSVHRKRGYMYRQFRRLHGNDELEDLCWFTPSTTMNKKLPRRVVDEALTNNPQLAAAEFDNLWREDVSDFLPLDVIEAVTDYGVFQRDPQPGVIYICFCDAAGGTGQDSFAFAIAHYNVEDNSVTLDLLREWQPRFIPRDAVAECAGLMNLYGIYEVRGDKYAGGFHSDEWTRAGKLFVPADYSTSDYYQRALPIFLARRNRMLIDNAKLRSQLASLERHVLATREAVKHPNVASAHDDLATAACGALVCAASHLSYNTFGGLDPIPETDSRGFQIARLHEFIQGLAMAETGGSGRLFDHSLMPRQMNWSTPYQSPFRRGF